MLISGGCAIVLSPPLLRPSPSSPKFQPANPLIGQRRLCGGFFTVLSDIWFPAEPNTTLQNVESQLRMQSYQMRELNETLTVYTTAELAPTLHVWHRSEGHVSALRFVEFDAPELLRQNGFNDRHLERMSEWHRHPKAHYSRMSDVLRLAIAAESGLAYLDLDMVLLAPSADRYLRTPVLAAPVWADESKAGGGTIEIQNSGFCLGRSQLRSTILPIITALIDDKGAAQEYFYTELGPHVFQRALSQLGPIELLPTCKPWEPNERRIVEQHRKYHFEWLHLCRSIREWHWHVKQRDFRALAKRTRSLLGGRLSDAPRSMRGPDH
jgi:hypothetical protein